jgi:hypothetical protein
MQGDSIPLYLRRPTSMWDGGRAFGLKMKLNEMDYECRFVSSDNIYDYVCAVITVVMVMLLRD